MSIHKERFQGNLARVRNLTSLFVIAKASHNRPSIKEADILRAAVVFLHSAFEDYLRAILIEWLPLLGNEDALSKISLIGQEGRAEKFTIAQLKVHEEMLVKDLISKSVAAHMQKVSFNDTKDIFNNLRKIKIDTSALTNAESINNMIKRRHKIVHEMDKNPEVGRGNHGAASIGLPTVNAWMETVELWVDQIDQQVTQPGFGT